MNTDMIVKELPRLGTAPLPAAVIILPTAEENRRDARIRELLRESAIWIGQKVRPADDDEFNKSGHAYIIGLARSYKEWIGSNAENAKEWSENPLIVAARYDKNSFVVNATVNYFKPA